MQRIAVVDARAFSAFGSLDATWNNLLAGRTAIKHLEMPGLGSLPAAIMPQLDEDLDKNDRLEKLIDLLLPNLPPLPKKTPVIVATTKGAVDQLYILPQAQCTGQPWNLPDEIAKKLGTDGPSYTVSAACASGLMAIISGMGYILSGQSSVAVAIGIEVLSTFVLAGFASLKALTPDVCRPFDDLRNGLALGEGGGLVILASEEYAAQKGWPVLATVVGYGAFCDAKHITAPCREASGLIAAIERATHKGALEIGAIHAHGTGTVHNDAMEITAFQKIWKEHVPPVHSVKGAIGHCLGAAGIIELAIAIKSLHAGILPPTVGLQSFATANTAWLSGDEPLVFSPGRILKCNSGFGGINVALVLEGVNSAVC